MFTKKERVSIFFAFLSLFILVFLIFPVIKLILGASPSSLINVIKDKDVQNALFTSLITSFFALLLTVIFGTPLAYILARYNFTGKRLLETLIDIPIVVPHTVAGIAILNFMGRHSLPGQLLSKLGLSISGNLLGITLAMLFVSAPFYIDALKESIKLIPERFEWTSRSLGYGLLHTFFRITLPLSKKGAFQGMILTWARAISEFGAVIIIAYHPMTAPVLIYERFETQGLRASTPLAAILLFFTILIFVILRMLVERRHDKG